MPTLSSCLRSYRLEEIYLRAHVYGTFMNGLYCYDSGEHVDVGMFEPETGFVLVPVPSRLYGLYDPRPLAGERVGVKDIYEVAGLKATWGSLAHWKLAEPSSSTSPALSHLLDLGAVIVGKQKTAQFASAGDPWQFQDFQYPFNPRGDGWLTCSASSSGGGCSIAAYDWLDYALGSDTGTSMRRPAAVAGVYANRPSQGLMALDDVMPISYSTDTCGVFTRDPRKWVKFTKHFYNNTLMQNDSMTGLPALGDHDGFPTKIIYPVDLLPLTNPAAEAILQGFIGKLTSTFGMTVHKLNVTDTVDTSVVKMKNLTEALTILWKYDQNEHIAKPLLSNWKARYGSFPPLDEPNRSIMRAAVSGPTTVEHQAARSLRRTASAAFHNKILPFTETSCSESVLLHDIGTGGVPSFREYNLNTQSGSTFPIPPGRFDSGAICPFFGCVDLTLPIGEVTYFSNVTFQEETMPVTINIVARRGCDRVLMNFVEKMADKGILNPVKTGRRAF
ncbi:hypothetical protein E4T47_03661 [Aureobasidium subglaciale]|nr:hypothetical protein E4T47_03661 [Aureobasidium subglaciale]